MVEDPVPWDDGDEEEEGPPEEEPEGWQDAVHCPLCGTDEVRLTERRYEVSVYLCERCGASFEVE